jgi:hypothetical protein
MRRLALLIVLPALACVSTPCAQAAGPPEVRATWVTEVTATSANLRAEIDPEGLLTTYRFEYVSDAAFQQDGFAGAALAPPSGATGIGGGTTAVSVIQHIAGLAPATSYHYRVAATNSAATVLGLAHTLTSEESSLVFALPDDRGWELVSPLDKGGGAIQGPGQNFNGDLDQAAAQGGIFTYSASTAFGEAQGAPPASQYVATRTANGWTGQNISTPLQAGAYGEEPDGVPYRLFSQDFGKALLYGGACFREEAECAAANPPLPGSGAPPGYANYYLRSTATASFEALLEQADVDESAVGARDLRVSVAAATPDLAHTVLSSCAALTADATEAPLGPGRCDPDLPNLYEWSATGLALVNLLPGDAVGTPGAEIAASLGAISADGARVYWQAGGNLYLREGGQTKQVDLAQGGGGSFETASADGSVAYFSKGAHLYRYLAVSEATVDLTPAGAMAGVLGASADGSRVYYQDGGGLRLWSEGATTTIAPGAAALPGNYPPATGAARVSADGTHLAFLSAATLTDYDNSGATEAYLYGPPVGGGAPVLLCASCNPTGERAQGSASLAGAPPNGTSPTPYKPRVLSADATRLFFESSDDLVVQDTNSRPDVYQWEAQGAAGCQRASGCVSLLSSGRSPGGAGFLDASADGSDVFFLTDASLVAADPGSIDVYDARVGGGFAEAPKPIPCVADACQALPAAPDDPTPGTLVSNPGNPPLHIVKQGQKKKKGKKKKGKKHRQKGGGR